MVQQPVISVRGEAYMEAEPEIAVISVTVEARDRDRSTGSPAATRRCSAW